MHFVSTPHADAPSACRRLAIKVDVDSLRGAIHGVPALIELLGRHSAGATFLFALGPDRSGRMVSPPSHVGAARRTGSPGALERYGFRGLLHGTLLPAPLLGARAEGNLRAAAAAGFEVGLRSWDAYAWQHHASTADAAWTRAQMQCAYDRFVDIVGTPPRLHAACGWQMNRHAFRLTQRLGFDYCSDTRGFRPYVPVLDAEIIACPQIPTTLPTFDELLRDPHTDRASVVDRMVEAYAQPAPDGHVISVSADCEGIALLPALAGFLDRLQSQGVAFMSLGAYLAAAGARELARHRVRMDAMAGRRSPAAMQCKEFLA